MKSRWIERVAVLAMVVFAVGCASSQQTFTYEPADIDPDYWLPKVDRFVVVVDGSGSMKHKYQREKKLEIERDLVLAMADSIPDLEYEAGLRAFGHGKCVPTGKTVLLEEVEAYLKGDFEAAGEKIQCAAGSSPMYAALDGVSGDLAGAAGGKVAAIVISDGRQMGRKTYMAADRLAAQYGDNLCIYSVLIGNSGEGYDTMQRIASATGCGRVLYAENLTDAAALGAFVKEVLLIPDSDADGVADADDKCPNTPRGVEVDSAGCPLDTDGDGVPDYEDKCPNTPKGAPVDADGCPLDSDGDGVPDYKDDCPGTARGVPVNARGCPIEGIKVGEDEWTVGGKVLFDVNKSDLHADGKAFLARVADFLKKNAQWNVEIQGHTDGTGPEDWNQELSERRAESVKAHLVELGVAASRLTTRGFGPHDPIATNATAEGRAQNRRVDFKPMER